MLKRSEAAKKLADMLFLSVSPTAESCIESEVFEALGQLGIEWPKEEPELPENLDFREIEGQAVILIDPRISGGGWHLAQAIDPRLGAGHPGKLWRNGILAELVRRYNAVGEVVKELESAIPRTLGGEDGILGAVQSRRLRSVYRKLKGVEP